MSHAIRNAYLSGWEYNRLLQEDLFESRNSALPAAVLWNGAHQFWLFEHVYCLEDSLENEYYASETLGWATGRILHELAEDDDRIVQSIDLAHLDRDPAISKDIRDRLKAGHAELRSRYTEHEVVELVRSREVHTLERIKAELLGPLLEAKQCVFSGAPNPLGAYWDLESMQVRGGQDARIIDYALSRLASPVLTGIKLCNRPGTDVPSDDVRRQREIEKTIEAPMIADLLLGVSEFSGPKGYVPYIHKLKQFQSAYSPINQQLLVC